MIRSFVAAGLVDQAAIFVAPLLLGRGVPICWDGGPPDGRSLSLRREMASLKRLGPDAMIVARAATAPGTITAAT